MAFDVFSQVRCPSPNRKDTAIKNYKHIFYISNRKHCLKNEYGNTLFGTIYDFDNIDKTDNKQISNYIYQKSKKGTNIYRGIVSLSEKDAIEQGLTNVENWETMFIDSVSQIAKNLGISFANLEWVATVHYKKGNPHLHYVLWDREQKVKDPIKVSTQHKIRNALKRSIYKEYYIEMMNNKNQAKKDLRAEQIRQEFKAIDKNYCNSKIAYINLDKQLEKELREDLKNIKEIKNTLEFFGVDKEDEGNQKRLRDLENGQCLFQDLYGRVGVIQIHPVFSDLFHAFDTRPPVQTEETR